MGEDMKVPSSGYDIAKVLRRMVNECEYKTPSGATNCRYCDCDMDHEGTHENMHAARCVVREAQAVLRYIEPEVQA